MCTLIKYFSGYLYDSCSYCLGHGKYSNKILLLVKCVGSFTRKFTFFVILGLTHARKHPLDTQTQWQSLYQTGSGP